MESKNINSNGENVVAIDLKLFHLFFFEIIEIEFKMKLQCFLEVGIFQVPTNHDLSYLSPHTSVWNG